MLDEESGKSSGTTTITARIPREEFSRFKYVCDSNGENINSALRRLILSEIDNPTPAKIAGKSMFEYNRQKDNFAWKVILDDDSVFNIDENLPANTIEQLLESIMDAVDKRNTTIKKSMGDSVSIPNKLLRIKK